MSEQPQDMQPVEDFTKVESIFIRHRNTLMLKADFAPVFTDYYIHLMEQKLRHKTELDAKLKDLMAMLTLHLVARPWAETIAWTANIRAPRVNFFATGGSIKENITGTLFTENVRETDRNILFSQTVETGKQPRKSTIDLDTSDPLEWIEKYYEMSEQRPGRAFRLDDDTYVLLAAQPGHDAEWFDALTQEDVKNILEVEQTKVLETRKFRFDCGCSQERLLQSLIAYKDKPDELFGEQESITATCPRCSAQYTFERDVFDQIEIVDNTNNEDKSDSQN